MSWVLVYQNSAPESLDCPAQPEFGHLAALRNAVLNGSDIRVGYAAWKNASSLRWNTESVRIDTESGHVFGSFTVYASNVHAVGRDQSTGRIILQCDAWHDPAICVVGTDGIERFWRKGLPTYISPQRSVQWFSNQ